MSHVPLPDVEKLVADALRDEAPAGLIMRWRVEEDVDWWGEPSLSLRLDVRRDRSPEYTPDFSFRLAERVRRGLAHAGDERELHSFPRFPEREAVE
jgi:hypothetical protein